MQYKSFVVNYLIFALGCALLLSCNSSEKNEDVAGSLVHLVYLNTKDTLSQESLKKLNNELIQLEKISQVKNLQVGKFEDLNDPRANKAYEQILYMEFSNKEDYQIYQDHPIHLELKKNLSQYLSGPPMTYDYKK